MTVLQRTLVIVLAGTILFFTFELIRRRKIWEKYALLWILTGVVLLICGIFPQIIYSISQLLGLAHLTTILLITFLFLLSIVLHFTAIITKRTEQLTKLSQQFAILVSRIDELEKDIQQPKDLKKNMMPEISAVQKDTEKKKISVVSISTKNMNTDSVVDSIHS